MKEMFSTCVQDNNTRNTRNFTRKLSQPYRKTNKGHKGLSYLGPIIWNSIDTRCKVMPALNTFKYSLKGNLLNELVKEGRRDL